MGFVIYRASAGSGKTFTLVKEYLKILLQDPGGFNHILAITFTNKAASEMKDRILHALLQLSEGSQTVLAEEIQKELPHLANLARQSRKILSLLLHHYSDFAITTIDSFMFRLIRAFSLELGLPLNFQVEMNTERISRYVEGQLMSQVGIDRHTTEVIIQYVKKRMVAGKSWNVSRDLRRFVKEIIQESNSQWVRQAEEWDHRLFFDFIEELNGICHKFTGNLSDLGEQGLELIDKAGLSIEDFPYKFDGAAGFLHKLKNNRPGNVKNIQLRVRFKEGKWHGKTMAADVKNRIDEVLDKGLREIEEEIMAYYSNNYSRALTGSVILEHVYLMALNHQIKSLVDCYKEESSIVPISEFGSLINDIVNDSPVPFIYSILGEKYNHYLMDEFQDTSALQWENLFPLIENSLAYNNFNMAVGDGKQSIYRWRGGDVDIMEREIDQRFDSSQLEKKNLICNFRSRNNIVAFNNRYFREVVRYYHDIPFISQGIYQDIEQKEVLGPGGHVSLVFGDRESDQTIEEQSTEHLITGIRDAAGRGYAFGDMAILVREGKEGTLAANCLIREKIPVISPDSLKLSQSPVVRFLIHVMAYLSDPSDRVSQCHVLFFVSQYLKGIPLEFDDIEHFYLPNMKSNLPNEVARLMGKRDFLIRLPLYEMVEEVIRLFRMPASVSHECAGYLQDFMDVVLAFHSREGGNISAFLDWWDHNVDDLSTGMPENKNAVTILTIHKAKGLEFPIVFVFNAAWKHKKDDQKLWLTMSEAISENPISHLPLLIRSGKVLEETFFCEGMEQEDEKVLMDNLNLLYVAFTRGIEELHVFAGDKKDRAEFLEGIARKVMDTDVTSPHRYNFGEPGKKSGGASEVEEPGMVLKDFVSHRWYPRIAIRKKYNELMKISTPEGDEKLKWGSLLHEIFSQVKYKGDEQRVLNLYVSGGLLPEEHSDSIGRMIENALKIPQVKEWFDPEAVVLTEHSLIHEGEVLRPDRVVFFDGRVIVVEFKSGKKHPDHAKQVRKYKIAIEAMGYRNVESYLFYFGDYYLECV